MRQQVFPKQRAVLKSPATILTTMEFFVRVVKSMFHLLMSLQGQGHLIRCFTKMAGILRWFESVHCFLVLLKINISFAGVFTSNPIYQNITRESICSVDFHVMFHELLPEENHITHLALDVLLESLSIMSNLVVV